MGAASLILPQMGDNYDPDKMRQMVRSLELYLKGLNMGNTTLVNEDFGAFAYNAQTLGAGSITVAGRVTYLRIRENAGAAATFNINGGNTISLAANDLFTLTPRSPLVSPTINWVSGNMNVFYERSS